MSSNRAQRDSEFPDAADLELQNISKKFGTTLALNHASLTVRSGSIHALLGENGAGKTTLVRIAFGMIRPDSGSINIGGKPVRFASPADAIETGVGMVHQQFSLVPEMTVAENIALGRHGKYDQRTIAQEIEQIATAMGVRIDPAAKVCTLAGSERQKLEIMRSFAHHAKILILDEPTALLTARDIGDLFAQLRAFADGGGSVVLITHKLKDALQHADEVTVLRHGSVILHAAMDAVDEEALASAMLGRAVTDQRSPARTSAVQPEASRIVLELTNVFWSEARGATSLSNISLEVSSHEVVGVAALEGSARPLLRMMAGRLEPDSGTITRPNVIGFVPEDRYDDATIPELSLTENTALRGAAFRRGRIEWDEIGRDTENLIEEYGIRASSVRSPLSALSGGNQQRFVLARELMGDPDLLVLENPTQGLDVHSAEAIHDRIRVARDSGTAIVMYSTDLDELAVLASRVVVVSPRGLRFTDPDRNAIGRMLLETAG